MSVHREVVRQKARVFRVLSQRPILPFCSAPCRHAAMGPRWCYSTSTSIVKNWKNPTKIAIFKFFYFYFFRVFFKSRSYKRPGQNPKLWVLWVSSDLVGFWGGFCGFFSPTELEVMMMTVVWMPPCAALWVIS